MSLMVYLSLRVGCHHPRANSAAINHLRSDDDFLDGPLWHTGMPVRLMPTHETTVKFVRVSKSR